MALFFKWMRDRFVDTSVLLDQVKFELAGIEVSYLDILIGFIAFGLVLAVFWKGART